MSRHGKYERNLIIWDPDSCQLKDERMEVLRLKCRSCGSTHAVLTMDIIPFFVYSIQAFLNLISLCMKPEGSVLQTERETGVSYQVLYRFLLIFHGYAKKLALFLRREGLWEAFGHPLGRQMLPLLFVKPPPWLQSGVFRQERVPLFLHRRTTAAYPLLFGAALS